MRPFLTIQKQYFFYNFNHLIIIKGAFRVEMQRETQKERTILCKYDPVEVNFDSFIFMGCLNEFKKNSNFKVWRLSNKR